MKNILRSKRGEGYFDTAILVLAASIVIALALAVYPVAVAKHSLNVFADGLKRQAEISGRVGTEIGAKIESLKENTKLNPGIEWDANFLSGNRIQLGDEFTVTLSHDFEIGFGPFGPWPINLQSKATGNSEVYW